MPRLPLNFILRTDEVSRQDSVADTQPAPHSWYFTKDMIDNHTPSRIDGIDRARESSLRKMYCTFLNDLGKRLRVSPLSTATAMMLCHRFYMHQSHAKNDWQTIATACMFLACKVEDSLRPLNDVTVVAYELIYKWDPSASQRIRQRDVYQKQKELILDAEHLVLVTNAFDISIQHPFQPLVDAFKRLKISNSNVVKAAWNLLNEWLRTTLCLQYKPQYIAAASLYVAAKLLKFKLPVNDGKAWWMEFDVSPKQLGEVTQQMLHYFKPYQKQKVSQVRMNVVKVPEKMESAMTQSSHSSVASALTVDSGLKEAVPVDTRLQLAISDNYMFRDNTRRHQPALKEASEDYSNAQCGEISGVMDYENGHGSSCYSCANDALSKANVHHLKGSFEKSRQGKYVKNKVVEAEEDEMHNDLIIDIAEIGDGTAKRRKLS